MITIEWKLGEESGRQRFLNDRDATKFNNDLFDRQSREYYEYQMSRVKIDPKFSAQIQIKSGNDDGKTNWLTLNKASAKIIAEWLKENYK